MGDFNIDPERDERDFRRLSSVLLAYNLTDGGTDTISDRSNKGKQDIGSCVQAGWKVHSAGQHCFRSQMCTLRCG